MSMFVCMQVKMSCTVKLIIGSSTDYPLLTCENNLIALNLEMSKMALDSIQPCGPRIICLARKFKISIFS